MVASTIDSGKGIRLQSMRAKCLNSCCQNAEGEFISSLYASYIMELLRLNGYSLMYSTLPFLWCVIMALCSDLWVPCLDSVNGLKAGSRFLGHDKSFTFPNTKSSANHCCNYYELNTELHV